MCDKIKEHLFEVQFVVEILKAAISRKSRIGIIMAYSKMNRIHVDWHLPELSDLHKNWNALIIEANNIIKAESVSHS